MTASTSFPPSAAPPAPGALVSLATQRRRRLRLVRTLAFVSLRAALLPRGAVRSRRRLQVCGSADVLSALGVRVRVVGAEIPWPRRGRVVVSDSRGWLGDLALRTAAPATPVLGRSAARALPPGSVVCPVALRYRTAAGYLRDDEIPRTPGEVAAARELVVEVHRLPALPPDRIPRPGSRPLADQAGVAAEEAPPRRP